MKVTYQVVRSRRFDYSIDKNEEGFTWVILKQKMNGYKFNICVCYLPPANYSRPVDSDEYFIELMKKVYDTKKEGEIIICGDFNARCADECDYLEGVDNVPPREALVEL